MSDDGRPRSGDERSQVERVLHRDPRDRPGAGRPLSRIATQTQRTVEGYLNAGVPPRWMQRVVEIDRGVAAERHRLEREYRVLRDECGADREAFARRWRRRAESWRFGALNELIRQHNDYYPIERGLPMDPRTGDYVLLAGRSYRRDELDAGWVLAQFPPEPPPGA